MQPGPASNTQFSEKELLMIDESYGALTKGREKCPAQFKRVPVPDPKRTKDSGYPVDKDEIRIRIYLDEQTVTERPIITYADGSGMNFHPMNDWKNEYSERHCDEMHFDDRLVWAKQWEAFQKGDAEQIIGYRLEVLWARTPSKATPYKYFGIHTAEQLRDASDATVSKIMGGYDDRAFVTKFLAAIESEAPAREAYQEIADLRHQLSVRDEEMREMREMIKQVAANQGGIAIAPALKAKPKTKKKVIKKVKPTDNTEFKAEIQP